MPTAVEELSEEISGGHRAIVISELDVDLRQGSRPNRLFVLKVVEGSLAAGGRGGGFGERRVVKVSEFSSSQRGWEKVFETEDANLLESFEVPFHVSRVPFILQDGSETMGYGVIDPPLVQDYDKRARPHA